MVDSSAAIVRGHCAPLCLAFVVAIAASIAWAGGASQEPSPSKTERQVEKAEKKSSKTIVTARRTDRGYLGITAADGENGALITGVVEGSPAQSAGLKRGDVVQSIGGEQVQNFDDLSRRMQQLKPGDEVTLRVQRGGEEIAVTTTLVERKVAEFELPPLDPAEWLPQHAMRYSWGGLLPRGPNDRLLGVETQIVTPALAESLSLPSTDGALVHSVLDGSPAHRAGLKPSDLIVELDGELIGGPQQLHESIRQAGPGAIIQIKIIREGKPEQLAVTLDPRALDRVDSWGRQGPLRSMYFFDPSARRIQELEQQVRELEKRVEQLERLLQSKIAPPAETEADK